MDARAQIDTILSDDRLDDGSPDRNKAEAIEALIGDYSWEAARDCMMDVLQDDRQARHWRTAADVFWGAVLDRRGLCADELIAWLYHRLDPDGTAEDNEVWSIVSKLRGVGYLSVYNPLQDPGVVRHLRAIRSRAASGGSSPGWRGSPGDPPAGA